MPDCASPVCDRPATRRGLCNGHYKRARQGQAIDTPIRTKGDAGRPERYWEKVDRGGADECWPWTAFLSPDGYGRFTSPEGILAHRYGYTLAYGAIPEGLVVDHTCHDPETCKAGKQCPHRACQNPAHMVLVTAVENGRVERRRIPNSERTHCPAGHAYDEENTLWSRRKRDGEWDGRWFRQCRACARERYHRRKGSS